MLWAKPGIIHRQVRFINFIFRSSFVRSPIDFVRYGVQGSRSLYLRSCFVDLWRNKSQFCFRLHGPLCYFYLMIFSSTLVIIIIITTVNYYLFILILRLYLWKVTALSQQVYKWIDIFENLLLNIVLNAKNRFYFWLDTVVPQIH